MKNRIVLILSILFAGLLVWRYCDAILFWDTVQFAGKHGSWYYEHGLFSGLLPEHLDSGHPPIFGMYIAALWKLFGKSLEVAHFGMLPFLFLNVWYAIKLGQKILGQRYWLFLLGFLLCPFYLGHCILVSPDIVLVTGFLICLYGIIEKRNLNIIIGSLLLSLISIRGVAVLGALVIYHFVSMMDKRNSISSIIVQLLKLYIWAGLIFLIYQVWHYVDTTWVGFHDDSPWSPSFKSVGTRGILYNMGLYGWRHIDHGMLIIYLGILFSLFRIGHQKIGLWKLGLGLVIFLGLLTIPFSGLINHRYYLPTQIVAILLFLQLYKSRHLGISLAVICLMALGNCLIYPDHIAQGWDSTAAHWAYYDLETEMYTFISRERKIPLDDIGTAFPLRVSRQLIDLKSQTLGYHEYDILTDNYILYTTVMNEFTDEALEELEQWNVLKSIEKHGIRMVLYERP